MRTSYPEKPDKVYFFGTCLVDMAYPQSGLAGIRLIQREGVKVIFPQNQSCCGQPAYNSGFRKEAKAVALAQIRAFPKDHPIVVPSGSCAGMMRFHYPNLFAGDPEEKQVRAFSDRIYELTEFLVHVLDVSFEDKGSPLTVTWHSSCHAAREMNIIGESKALIRQLKNVRLIELEEEEQCCGFGGTFSVKQPDISEAMVKDKIEDIRKTGAEKILTGDCGCLMNITGAMARGPAPITGQHIADFLWERTDG